MSIQFRPTGTIQVSHEQMVEVFRCFTITPSVRLPTVGWLGKLIVMDDG